MLLEPRHTACRKPHHNWRRKWPGWHEQVPGQIAEQPNEWTEQTTLQEIHESIPREAKATAGKTLGCRSTPSDTHASHLLQQRAAARSHAHRKLLQRCVTEIRKWQRRWRYDVLLHKHSAKGRHQGKMPKLTGRRLQGTKTIAIRVGNFEDHWRQICGDSAAAHIFHHETKLDDKDLAAAQFLGESTITHEAFLHLVQHLPNGVLGEYIKALHAEQVGTLFAATIAAP